MKKSTFIALFMAAILLIGSHQKGWGQLFVDNFSYSVGTALSANGWNVTGTAATPVVGVTATSISYPGYLSSGIGDEVTMAVSGEDVNHTFTSQTSGSVYASCLVNVTSATVAGDYFFHLGGSTIGSSFHGRVFIKRDASNNVAFGISRAGAVATAVFTPFSYALNTTYLVVLKYTIVAGTTNDVAQIYINPALNSVEPSSGWTLSTDTPADLASIGTVALRQGGATTGAALKIDGVRVATNWDDIVGAAPVPTISVTPPTPLTGFTYVVGNGPSAPQNFSVGGTNLTNDISISAATDFEVSLSSGSGYTTPLILTQSGGTVSGTTIYTRLKAGLGINTYSAEPINITSTGATPTSVLCSGIVTSPSPTIIVGSLTGFGNQTINTLSSEKSYTVTGLNLTADIAVTPPTGFEISATTGTGFVATSITLTQTAGSVNATVYVRFAPTVVQPYSGSITHTSAGAPPQDVAVSGTGANVEPTNHVTNFIAGTTTTTDIPLTWTDATGGVVPEGYLIKASPTSYSDISAPIDGVPEVNSTLVHNVTSGIGNVTFTGLNSGTPYFFKIYPYTNSGTAIAYNTTNTPTPVPEATATTIVVPYLALYEDFNYTPPAFIGGNGSAGSSSNNWVTHSGSVGTIDVLADNLNYAGLAASSGYKVRLPGTGTLVDRDVNRALTITPNTSAVLYYSVLINVVDATQLQSLIVSDYFIHFNAQSGGTASTIYGARLALHATTAFANYRLSIKNTSGGGTDTFTDFPQDLNFGQTYLVVVKYDRSASPTIASLWVDPTSLGGAEPAGATVNASGINTFLQFGSISLRNSITTPNVDIDEIRIGTTWADVTPAGVPTVTTTPASLSDFIYFVGSGPSPSQSFIISASALTPTNGFLTVTQSASYEVSADNVTFGATASISYSQATFTSSPVFVRIKAGLPIGTYNENITVSGGGATSVTVACNGTVAALTPIIIIPGSLDGFGNQVINVPSAEKTYNVSGSFLTGNIIITPPVGFEISTTSGTGFVANPNTLTLTQSGGTVPNTTIYVRFVPTLLQVYNGNILNASAGATNENVIVSGTGIKGEPDNFPTLFATGTVTSTSIPLTWTDATTGLFIPDGYLIKGSTVSYNAISSPNDLEPVANSALVQNVAQGVQSFTFNSLTPGGTYYFKIFPYTNSGSAIDYKVFFAPPQASAQTLPPPVTTYTWNQTISASWSVSTNWTPERITPALNDILVINGALTPAATITSIPSQTIAQLNIINGATAIFSGATVGAILTIAGATGTDLVVESGSTLNLTGTVFVLTVATGATASISGNMTVSGAAHKFTAADAGGITFNSGAVFTTGAGFSSNPFGTTSLNSVIFGSGSTFVFTIGSNPFGAAAPASVIVFQTGSLYKHQSTNSPSFSGRTYANVEFNIASTFALSGATTTMDNLTVTLGTVNFSVNGITIKGNISVASGATLNFIPYGTVNLNGTGLQTITNNGTLSFGTNTSLVLNQNLDITGIVLVKGTLDVKDKVVSGTGTLNCPGSSFLLNTTGNTVVSSSTLTNVASITGVAPGMLITGANIPANTIVLTTGGTGPFTIGMSASATLSATLVAISVTGNSLTLKTSSPYGIDGTNTFPVANKTFDPTGTFVYYGTSAQVTGNLLPVSIQNLTIDNASGVSLTAGITVTGNLSLTNGLLTLGSNNLTLGATASVIGTPSSSNMVVAAGTGELRKTFTAAGSFTFPVGDNDGTAEYSPVTLNFTAGTFASAYAGVNLVNSAYPGSTGNYLNRYWNITSSGITSYTCDAQFNYVVADVTGIESSIYGVLISPQTYYAPANTTLHQLTASGVTSLGTFTGRELPVGDKTLNLTLFLEGLYAGGGFMNQAYDGTGPHFGAGIADQVTVVLYDGIALVHTASNVNLLTNGTLSITIPAALNGSYYIGIKHRNSIETASALPVSFAGSAISYNFSTSASQAYAGNLINLGFSGVYGIYAGDENQDGLVESGDMIDVDNAVAAFAGGYIATDINGDGLMDSSDMIYIDNNNAAFVSALLPY